MFLTSHIIPVPHLFTTRRGGVSRGVFDSMNLASGSGDLRDFFENVIENHDICARSLGYTAHDVCRTFQAHTTCVEVVTAVDKAGDCSCRRLTTVLTAL